MLIQRVNGAGADVPVRSEESMLCRWPPRALARNMENIAMPRYSIDLGSKLDKLLDDLSKRNETTKSEIIRRAVASYAYLDEERKAGRKLSIVDDKDRIVKEVVLP